MTEESADTDSYTLTPAGWPRPRFNGMPIPWVAPAERLSEVNEGRRTASAGGAICQVCGLGWEMDNLDAYGFAVISHEDRRTIQPETSIEDLVGPGVTVYFLDGAIMHLRCAKITARMCPHVYKRDDLVMLRVPANDADPQWIDKTLRATYSSEDCTYVPWPIPRRSS